MTLEAKFRKLRDAWFRANIKRNCPERQWETEEQEAAREDYNKLLKAKFDQQTDMLIEGKDAPLIPLCPNDLKETR